MQRRRVRVSRQKALGVVVLVLLVLGMIGVAGYFLFTPTPETNATLISMSNRQGQAVRVPLTLYHLLGAAAADQVPVSP
jgi:uncharacterized protein involved in exopolysaccharide biosynthesis